jgi:uncharacterized protein YggE
MNKSIISIGLILLLVVGVFLGTSGLMTKEVLAETDSQVNVVTVSGTGEVTVKPDVAHINVGVETENKDAALAQSENAEKMNQVMAALKAAGIKDEDIKTVQYSVYDTYNYLSEKENEKIYKVNNVVAVTIRDIDAVGSVIDQVAQAGSNSISSIQFGISNENEVYQEALKLAMQSAKGKANSILETFGKTANAPVRVSETSYYSGIVRAETSYMMDAKMATPVSAGELTITAQVSVDYNY